MVQSKTDRRPYFGRLITPNQLVATQIERKREVPKETQSSLHVLKPSLSTSSTFAWGLRLRVGRVFAGELACGELLVDLEAALQAERAKVHTGEEVKVRQKKAWRSV